MIELERRPQPKEVLMHIPRSRPVDKKRIQGMYDRTVVGSSKGGRLEIVKP